MIIFGTRGINRSVGSGMFNCPRCSSQQPYTQKAVKRFFTLYFIPLIPMGSAGGFIECDSCAGTFDDSILTYNPAVEQEKTIESFRRMSIAFLLDVNRCKSAELEALQDVVGDLANKDVESSDIANDVRLAQEANVELMPFLKKEATDLSDEGRWLVLVTFRRILEKVSPLMQHEKDRLMEIGKVIGLRKKHLEEFLESSLESEP